MTIDPKGSTCDGQLLKRLLSASVSWLDYNHQGVNDMNVFPVPDGDTGTNMLFTVQNAYASIAQMDEKHFGKVIGLFADGAFRKARGNSGTILSMLLKGFAQDLTDDALLDAPKLARASRAASDYAYNTVQTVMKPVEGTILTVARETADAAMLAIENDIDLRSLLDAMIDAAKESLQNTPNLLPRLKQAGVVDSGGMGLVYILQGMQRLLDGKEVSEDNLLNRAASNDWQDAIEPDEEEGYGYDVQFLIYGEDLDVDKIRQDISAMGWSPLIHGDKNTIKVHIHVYDPGVPISYAIGLGTGLDDFVVENMQLQYHQYVKDRMDREEGGQGLNQVEGVAVVTVARGDGLEEIFRQYNATRIIVGGQTMNPSVEDFLNEIDTLNTDEIILLPNNKNVIMAAQQAAQHQQGKKVYVVGSRTIPEGLAALIAYGDMLESDQPIESMVEAMESAIQEVVSCEVTQATRSVEIDGVEVAEGQFIGLVNGRLVVARDKLDETLQELFVVVDADAYELATICYGEDVNAEEAQATADRLAELYQDMTFEIVYGGQPLYPYIISIE